MTDFDDALQMVIVETAFGRYPKHLLDVYTGKVVGRQERGDVVKSWQHVEKMSASGNATGDVGDDGFGDDDEILLSSLPPAEALKMLKAKAKAKNAMASMYISRDPEPEELELHRGTVAVELVAHNRVKLDSSRRSMLLRCGGARAVPPTSV